MSINSELARIKGAKADLKSWIEENGVTVPDGTLIDGLVELAKTVETGGGGDDAAALDGLIGRSITNISNDRVTSIGRHAFYNCPELTTVYFPAATSIGTYAFGNCSKLTTADFPMATDIGDSAFYNCSKLTTVYFPAVTSTGTYVFQNCSKLTTVYFPAATSIGNSAFYNCPALTTADFTLVKSIGPFVFYNCSKLTALILRNTNAVCTLSSTTAFNSTPIASRTGYIYVPSALVDSYKAATNWSTYANQIRAIEDYPEITGGAA